MLENIFSFSTMLNIDTERKYEQKQPKANQLKAHHLSLPMTEKRHQFRDYSTIYHHLDLLIPTVREVGERPDRVYENVDVGVMDQHG